MLKIKIPKEVFQMVTSNPVKNPESPQTQHKVALTSAEVASMWQSYMNDTSAVCTIGSFLTQIEDEEIRSVLEYAMQISQAHVQKLKSFFIEEKIPVPQGFSAEF